MHGAPAGMTTYLTVSEIFGPTLQGEGPSQGRPVGFLRLGLCNLDCAWCDTPYTWDWTGKNGVIYDKATELRRLTINEVVEQVSAIGASRLVVTGGEPLIQAKGLAVLADILYDVKGMSIEIETNGTLPLPETLMAEGIGVNCSPKLANSGIPVQKRINPHVLRDLSAYGAAFKFVVRGGDDIPEVEQIISIAGVKASQVWLMPEGISQDAILSRLPELFDICSERGWSLAPRLHVLAHGDKRGI